MSSIDERVVRMTFDNGAFHNGVRATLDDLKGLQQGLKLSGATSGLEEVNKAASRFSLAGMKQSVQGVLGQFSGLQIAAVTAFATIANQALVAGQRMASAFTTKPIIDGFHEYETNLNSIQTILANTGLKGADGLGKVNAALGELNTYSDKTIYNFSDMARNIGTFTAAGVNLDSSTAAIKGIANLAALSGSNSQQASTAMYQLSQAMAAGKATLVDWNSVVNAGMGGKVFQDALVSTAKVQGKNVDELIKKNGSFRDSLQEGWLTTGVLTDTLKKFTGDLNADQLKSMGYNQEQIAGIIEMGQTASDAATKVKTVSQLVGTLQEAIGSGWSQTFQQVFGDFDEAKVLFTNVNNVLGGMISASSAARNKVIGDWKALGGRGVLIDALSNAFSALMGVIKPISAAFKQIFPPATGKQLYDITVAIRNFTAGLKIGGTTANNLQRTFAGFFAILGIGWEVIKAAASALLDLLGVATGGAGSFLEFTAGIGDFLVALLQAIKNGDGLKKFFSGLAAIISVPLNLIKQFASAIAGAFSGTDLGSFGTSLGKLVSNGISLQGVGKVLKDVWSNFYGTLQSVFGALAPAAAKFEQFFKSIGEQITGAFGEFDYQTFLATINTGLFAGLLLILKNFKAKLFSVDIGGDFFSSLTDGFDGLTGALGGMQDTLRATTLLEIAAAIALLAGSLVILSHIDSEGLIRGSAAIGVLFAQLIGATAAFAAIGSFKAFVKLPLVGAGLILISAALLILTKAVKELSTMNWEELGKGLTGVVALLGSLAGTAQLLSGSSKGLVTAGVGFILIAAAIRILVGAVQQFAGMDWEGIAKGLTGVAGLLVSLALFSKLTEANKGGIAQGAGILLLAAGIKVLADAVQQFGTMSWETIGKGLVAMAGGLTLMGLALNLIPPSSILSAAAILVVASSLSLIGDAIAKMGGFSWETIGKGLVTLAGALVLISGALALLPPTSLLSAAAIFVVASSLGMITDALGEMGGMSWGEIAKSLVELTGALAILAAGMYVMTAALPGAAALLVIGAALALIGPVLVSFGDMSWESIAKGLVTLAGALAVIGIAAALLTPVIPSMIGLGVAIALLGAGALLAGVGVLAFSAGLAALAVSGAAGAAAIVAIVTALLGMLPMIATQLGLAIIAFAKVIAAAGPAIVAAITTVLGALLQAIIRLSPQIGQAISSLVNLLIDILVKAIPRMVNAGLQIIIGILNGISNNIGRIVQVGGDIVVKFLNGVSAQIPRITQAAMNLVVTFINSCASAIRGGSSAMNAAGANLASALIQGMVNGISSGIGAVASAAKSVASSAVSAAKNALGIHSPSKVFTEIGAYTSEGFANGLVSNKDKIDDAVKKMTDDLKSAMTSTDDDIKKATENLQKLTEARDEDNKKILEQGKAVQDARTKDNNAILDAQNRLNKLKSAKKKDNNAIGVAQRNLDDAKKRSNEAREVAQLGDMTKARDKDNVSLAKAADALNELKLENKKLGDAYGVVTKRLEDEHQALDRLADRVDDVKERIKDANKVLEDAIKTRDDYARTIATKYDDLPELKDDLTIKGYTDQITKQIEDVKKFAAAIQQARGLGLNDQLYKELLEKGPSALPFIQQLIDSGKTGISEINDLGSQLAGVTNSLGIQAGNGLYQAGVNSAEGLVKGLQNEQAALEKQMSDIANSMVNTVKQRLGIHSPSTEMAELGAYSVQGLVKGLDDSSNGVKASSENLGKQITDGLIVGMTNGIPAVTAAASAVAYAALTAAKSALGVASPSKEFAKVGQWSSQGLANGLENYSGRVTAASSKIGSDAITAMSKSISGMSDILGGDVDLNPTITPVLDLTSIKKDAATVGSLLSTQALSVSDAYSVARNASAGYRSNQEASQMGTDATTPATVLNYTQNNSSPKALSTVELYRQTRNQLSVAKGALSTYAQPS